jgi:hypothetical protein
MAGPMDAFITEAFTLLGLAIFIMALRTYARWSAVGFRNFAADDYLMVFAGVSDASPSGALVRKTNNERRVGRLHAGNLCRLHSCRALFWSGKQRNDRCPACSADPKRPRVAPPDQRFQNATSRMESLRFNSVDPQAVYGDILLEAYVGSHCAQCAPCAQACEAVRLTRLREGLHMKTRINIAYGSIAVTYVATVLSILFGCHPFEKNWQIYPDPGSEYKPSSPIRSGTDVLRQTTASLPFPRSTCM